MLDSPQLALAITVMVCAIFFAGMLSHWIWARLGRKPDQKQAQALHDLGLELDRCMQECAQAKQARETAETEIGQLQSEIENIRADRNNALAVQLRESKAENQALMDGLRTARQRISQLEAGSEKDSD